jgi:hypothetical protein
MTHHTEISTALEEHDDPKPIGNLDQSSELTSGEEYYGTVDRVSSSGNAIIQSASNQHINLSGIDESAVGEEVKFRYLGGVWGECLDNKYIPGGYDPGPSSSDNSPPHPITTSERSYSMPSGQTRDGTITENEGVSNKLLKGKL